MECYICLESASEISIQRGWRLVQCDNCGSYAITVDLISSLAATGERLKEDFTVTWLASRRGNVAIPMIRSSDANRVAR